MSDTYPSPEEFEEIYSHHTGTYRETNRAEWLEGTHMDFAYIQLGPNFTFYLNQFPEDLKIEGRYFIEYRKGWETAGEVSKNIPFIERHFLDVFHPTEEERVLFKLDTGIDYPL